MSFLTKLLFLIKRPILIVVTGKGRACAAEAIFQVLKKHFGKTKFLILEGIPDLFFVKKARKTILVITAVGEIPADEVLFAGEKKDVVRVIELAKVLPKQARLASPFSARRAHLVLNADDETVREIKDESKTPALTFGLSEATDFQASDIHISEKGTNFKLNYKGNIVPIWLENLFGKKQMYSVLAATAVGMVLDINLVKLSQTLRFYQSLPGKMRLIKGIKNSQILDDSANANPFSMVEALGILGKIPASGRKIAVLGDVLGIGKYTTQSHEAIGEKVAGSCDLLFTVGARAKFITQGAIIQGMSQGKVFQFMQPEEAGLALQKELRQGDLILIDGSQEMEMSKIVEELRTSRFAREP